MGLLDSIPIRLPRLRGNKETLYRATIAVDGGGSPFTFMFYTDRRLEDPFIVENESPFVMPSDPVFVKTQTAAVDMPTGKSIPMYDIQPADGVGGGETVEIPEELHGKEIPRIEKRLDEVARLVE
jgi:hypothetical protein